MKVLLVKCLDPARRDVYAFRQIPLGIASLVAVLQNRHEVIVHDMLVDDDLIELIQTECPDVIGLSIFSVDFTYIKKLLPRIRKVAPNITILAGGTHPTAEPVQTLNSGIDFVIRGEGEDAIVSLINVLENDGDLSNVPGISYFAENGVDVINNPVKTRNNIDEFPMPAVEAFDYSKYTQYPLLTARGCPYGCNFCATKVIWGQSVRFHSASRVCAEINRAVEVFGQKRLVFIDDTFTLNHERLNKICDYIINQRYETTWSINSRVDTIDDDVANKMKQAGCEVVSFGIETGSELIQKKIGKKITIKQMEAAVAACRKNGLRVKTGWMIGLPGDVNEQIKSLDVMIKLNPDEVTIHHFIPMPGTPYWDNPGQYGINFDKQRLLESFSIDALPWDIGLSFDYISHDEIKEITTQMIDRLRDAGYKRPGDVKYYGTNSKVVNTYMDRNRLPVLTSEGK